MLSCQRDWQPETRPYTWDTHVRSDWLSGEKASRERSLCVSDGHESGDLDGNDEGFR